MFQVYFNRSPGKLASFALSLSATPRECLSEQACVGHVKDHLIALYIESYRIR